MDALAWGVVAAVAAVLGVIATLVGPIPQLRGRHKQSSADDTPQVDVRQYLQAYIESQQQPATAETTGPVVVGEVPQPPPAFQPREDLVSELGASGPGVVVVRALTGMRGVGKTQVAAAYARARIDAGWRLVAWVNAEDTAQVVNGLADVAASLNVGEPGADLERIGEAVRHRLEADGQRCLVVFDNVTDLDGLRPFLPSAGQCQVIITSNQVETAGLGKPLPVDVFTEDEALSFLAERTSRTDPEGARALAAELESLPLALAQAAAVIAAQHLDYQTYLDRLRAQPVQDYLKRTEGDPYPHGVGRAILLALDAVSDGDHTGLCRGLINVLSMLSAAGVTRALLYAAGHSGLLRRPTEASAATPQRVDAALRRLASASLLSFTSRPGTGCRRPYGPTVPGCCAGSVTAANGSAGTRLGGHGNEAVLRTPASPAPDIWPLMPRTRGVGQPVPSGTTAGRDGGTVPDHLERLGVAPLA
jgi:NB-ARC domain